MESGRATQALSRFRGVSPMKTTQENSNIKKKLLKNTCFKKLESGRAT